MAILGTIQVQRPNGVEDEIPIVDATQTPEKEIIKVRTPSGNGFFLVDDPGNTDFPFVRVQTANGIKSPTKKRLPIIGFEDGNLNEYNHDNNAGGSWEIESPGKFGTNFLIESPNAGGVQITNKNITFGRPIQLKGWTFLSDPNNVNFGVVDSRFQFGLQNNNNNRSNPLGYGIRIGQASFDTTNSTTFVINKYIGKTLGGNNNVQLAQKALSNTQNIRNWGWTIDWNTSGQITYKVWDQVSSYDFNETRSPIITLSASDNEFVSGFFGFYNGGVLSRFDEIAQI